MRELLAIAMPHIKRELPLSWAIAGLRHGGFDGHIDVLCEPGCLEELNDPKVAQYENIVREGALGNWRLALRKAMSHAATYYMVCEDDVLFSTRAFQEARKQLHLLGEDFGYVSLYTAKRDEVFFRGFGWQSYSRGMDNWGSLAMIFSYRGARALLDFDVSGHNRIKGQTDGLAAEAMRQADLKCYHRNPSLVDHARIKSAVGHANYAESNGLNYQP